MTMDRRTLTKVAAVGWTTPVIAGFGTAPAFAASAPLTCGPTARCKHPGDPNDKSYVVDTNCTSSNGAIVRVEVQNVKTGEWINAEQDDSGAWVAPGFGDSRRDRPVRITDAGGEQAIYTVSFPPC